MSDSDDRMSYGADIFEGYEPSREELKEAAAIPANGCPRRYCWWWKSLAIEWELSPAEGCMWPLYEKPAHWKLTDVPCCRCDSSSGIDHFEPREPHIEKDGVDGSKWLAFLKENQRKFPG